MSCNKCKEADCGCQGFLGMTPNFSNDPSVCPPDSEPCAEVFDMACIAWCGADICELDVKNGDRLDEVLQKVLLSIATISCLTPTQGDPGDPGAPGLDAEVNVISTNTLPAGSPALVTDTNPDPRIADLVFDIPQGQDGNDGLNGEVNVIATNTIAAGNPASVIDSNPDPRIADLTFNIPQGPAGPPGPGLDLDFGNPTNDIILNNSNVVFNSVWAAVAYTPAFAVKYGNLKYWNISADLAYVQWYIEWDARGNGGALQVGNKGYTTAMSIAFTGLPFSVESDPTYTFGAVLKWDGRENNVDYGLAGLLWSDSEIIGMTSGGVGSIVVDTVPNHYVPAVDTTYSATKKWSFYYSGYVFKA